MVERAKYCPFCGEPITVWYGVYENVCTKCKASFIVEETDDSERVIE